MNSDQLNHAPILRNSFLAPFENAHLLNGRVNLQVPALQGNPSAFAGDSSAFERVDFLNERQAITRTFSDIDDIGGAPHLVENRFRLNGAAAIFEVIHTQEFPVRQFAGKQKNSVFCIHRHFHSC
jgi:hypothetical protein